MGVLDHIDTIRQKPIETRRRIHVAVTLAIMAVIVIIWGLSATNMLARAVSGNEELASPFRNFSSEVGEQLGSVREGYVLLKDRLTPDR